MIKEFSACNSSKYYFILNFVKHNIYSQCITRSFEIKKKKKTGQILQMHIVRWV